jgi:hypothetical protein
MAATVFRPVIHCISRTCRIVPSTSAHHLPANATAVGELPRTLLHHGLKLHNSFVNQRFVYTR